MTAHAFGYVLSFASGLGLGAAIGLVATSLCVAASRRQPPYGGRG